MWKKVLSSSESPVLWHLDATGSILKSVPNQKRPFLYTMAYHDKEKKMISSVFDFISCCHKGYTVENYLSTTFSILKEFGQLNHILPYGIVTDFSF
jgi:hypothetical protein